MILAALVDLAERQALLENPDYEKRRVAFELNIRPDGTYIGLVSRLDEKGRGVEVPVPRMPKRASGVAASFLFDNSKYVLGIGDSAKEGNAGRLLKCVAAFRSYIDAAARVTQDSSLLAVARFYQMFADNRARVLADRPEPEWKGSENLAFRIEGIQGLVHEQPAVQTYWAALRTESPTVEGGDVEGPSRMGRCLVTGELALPARLHPSLKRVPGGQSSGTSLVSFNSRSFESHGLSQGENAPVSRKAAEAYTTALNWLLEKAPASDRQFRYGVKLGDDSVAVFWTEADTSAMDWFARFWNEPKPEEVKALLDAPFTGTLTPNIDEKRFFALILGGNAARAVIRSWFASTIAAVKTNLWRYFDDLRVGADQRPLAIWQLLAAIDPPGNASVPPDLAARIYTSSVQGTPLPRELLRHALARLRVPPDKERSAAALLHARVALIKATLRGMARYDINKKQLEVNVSLDDNNNSAAYNLGRLFALLEQIQAAALNDPNATIRDRYFGAASSTPAFVFPRLLKLSAHHESKIGAGLAYNFDERKRRIMRNFDAVPMPTHQSLEDQGLFAVGYYHERDWLIEDRKRRSEESKRAKAREDVVVSV